MDRLLFHCYCFLHHSREFGVFAQESKLEPAFLRDLRGHGASLEK
jgi:hypothetical protein